MTEKQEEMIHLIIDGKEISVQKGTTVYTASKQLGIEVPIFCYQDRMPPFGACRMCLVEVEKMPKLQTSCTLMATEGMVVHTQSQKAVENRKGILELLLINHPLDCPICDKGGECPLQDNTLKFGPGKSRFYEEKRRLQKHLSLGPVLKLDRERCIICARCTRFGEIIAGDHALEFFDRGYKTEVGTPNNQPAQSKFIGNTIQICPVGALTSDVYRFRARPWDNDSVNTSCTLCPVGCSMILDSRDGEIMRTRALENRDVNDMWLCDKGWFGYEFTDHPNRLKTPLIRQPHSNKLEPASWEEALDLIAKKMTESKPAGKLAAFGGNPLTTEENYLFQKLMREVVGVNHLDHRIGTPILSLEEEGIVSHMEISIGECEQLSYLFLLGLDLTEEFPIIWLRVKQAINHGAKVYFIGHFTPEIAPHLTETVVHAPGLELETLRHHLPKVAGLATEDKKGALFVGRQYLQSASRLPILTELTQLRQSTPHLSLNLLESHGNSLGARFAGMRPDLGPAEKRLTNPGLNAIEVLEKAANSGWDFLYVVAADPAIKFPSKLWREARNKLNFLVVQDLFLNETARQADVVLPSQSFVEKRGSMINIEARIQPLLPGKLALDGVYNDGDIFFLVAQKLNHELLIDDDFAENLKHARLHFERASLASTGQQQSSSYSEDGLYASFAPALFDHGVRMKHNLHLVQLVKEPVARIHPEEAIKRGVHDGEKVHLKANEKKVLAKIKWDEGVAKGTIVLPLGFEQIPVHEFGPQLLNGLKIEILIEV